MTEVEMSKAMGLAVEDVTSLMRDPVFAGGVSALADLKEYAETLQVMVATDPANPAITRALEAIQERYNDLTGAMQKYPEAFANMAKAVSVPPQPTIPLPNKMPLESYVTPGGTPYFLRPEQVAMMQNLPSPQEVQAPHGVPVAPYAHEVPPSGFAGLAAVAKPSGTPIILLAAVVASLLGLGVGYMIARSRAQKRPQMAGFERESSRRDEED